jgi:hypothetical protein
MKTNSTSPFVVYGVYDTSAKYKENPLVGMCGLDPTVDITDNFWASRVYVERIPLRYAGLAPPPVAGGDDTSAEDDKKYLFTADFDATYLVKVEGWYNVVMELCESDGPTSAAQGDDMLQDVMTISGDISFKNPYGYLPASLCGLLPFQGALLLAYIATTFGFSWSFCRYFSSAVSIHYGVLAVLGIAIGESTSWLLAYVHINATGTPYCCPFPTVIVASLIFQILRQAVSRCLLLVISLGYGIVRPKLERFEWLGIAFITGMYFVAATVGQVFDIEIQRKLSMGSDEGSTVDGGAENEAYVYFAEAVVDSAYITWIAFALSGTIQLLKDYQQTYKLQLYNRLYSAIYAFILVFALLTTVLLLSRNGVVAWPWQLEWVPVVLWPTFNFAVLATICVICTPSDSSRYLAYSSQLPTFDPDDSSVDEFNDTSSDVTGFSTSIGMAEEDDDVLSGHHNQQKYDMMTPPVVKLMYKQQHSHGKITPSPNRTSSINISPVKYNVQINPIHDENKSGSASKNPPQLQLSAEEQEFEMVCSSPVL